MNRYGITGVIDPGGHNLKPSEYAALFEMAERGNLSLRVAFSALAPRPGRERQDFERLIEDYSAQKHPLLQFNGIGEAITWGFYNNNNPTPDQQREFESVALWAASKGLRLTIHWNTDLSVHHVLNAFEHVNARHEIKPLRWSVAHPHDASRGTIERMHRLGLGWLVQNAGYFAAPSYTSSR